MPMMVARRWLVVLTTSCAVSLLATAGCGRGHAEVLRSKIALLERQVAALEKSRELAAQFRESLCRTLLADDQWLRQLKPFVADRGQASVDKRIKYDEDQARNLECKGAPPP